MRTKSIILLLIALGFGLVASIGMSQLAGSGDGGAVPTGPVYVTLDNIGVGEELTDENVKLEQWPADRIPPTAITTPEGITDMVPVQPMFAGEPLIADKIDHRDRLISASNKVPKGMRIVSVKVAMDTAVSHLILPGDHVDVMSLNKAKNKAETILSNIQVFAVNSEINRRTEDDNGNMQAKTISVAVYPEQAEILHTYADSKLRLALRSKEDDDEVQSGNSSSNDFDPSLMALEKELPQEPVDSNAFTMVVVGGDGNVQEYNWDDAESGKLPNEVSNGSAPSFGGTAALPPFAGAGAGAPGGGASEDDGGDSSDRDGPSLD